MIHAFATAIFTLIFALWLSFETKRKADFRKYIGLIATALISPLLASVASATIGGQAGNFVLHAVGGGVASGLVFVYFIKSFDIRVVWRFEGALLFAFVSSLGVLNEFAEYFIEACFGIIMSVDTRDTWRDFVANTVGAFVAWVMLKILFSISARRNRIK